MRSHSRHLRRTRCPMKEDVGEQESARRATPSFLGRWPCLVGRFCEGWCWAGGCCRRSCYFAYVGCSSAGLGVRTCCFVRGDLGERCTCSSFAGSVKADLKRSVEESLAKRFQWAGDSGRARATETLVGQFREHSVRISARLSALGEAEEAKSSTGGLLRRCVGAMTRSDKGNRRRLLCR
jgi:hypothetical protein